MILPIIIPYFKKKEVLERCIEHLNAQDVPIEIYIRDNSEDNIYFTAAVNEGIKHFLGKSDWEYLVILNQDMFLAPNALREMVKFMDNHPKCGIGMPIQCAEPDSDYETALKSGKFVTGISTERLMSLVDSSFAHFAGGAQAFPIGTALVGTARLFTRDVEISWGDGGCLMLRKEMIQEIGLLDENLRFVCQDSDYCFTARARGWQVWRTGKASGLHIKGQAFNANCGYELNLIKANDVLYFAAKWLTGDLYRKLAHEEEDTSEERIKKEVVHLEEVKAKLENLIKEKETVNV